MCGICGIFGFDDRRLTRSMTRILEHRGPNHEGYFFDSSINLGYRRLSIIDLDNGRQPIANEERSKYVICNGEIYNYLELRKLLEEAGHRFRTDSDTEVIVHSFEEWGIDCISKFNGMFAIALWDGDARRLYLIRDRLGKKPLYYYICKKGLLFSSEIKSILLYDDYEKVLNFDAVINYFQFRYNIGSETMFKNIRRVEPGSFVVCDKKGFRSQRYWDIDFRPARFSEDHLLGQLAKQLESSVRLRMRSDVPRGLFLSGGLDSSLLLSYASRFDSNLNTFSLGFADYRENELEYAKSVSQFYGCEHHEIVLDQHCVNTLPLVVWFLDEPLADSTAIPNYFLARRSARKAKVLFSGEGADELFMGYEQYKLLNLIKAYKRFGLDPFARVLLRLLHSKEDAFFERINGIASTADYRLWYEEMISVFKQGEIRDFLKQRMPKGSRTNLIDLSLGMQDSVAYFELKNWLPNDILLKTDKMTMANSIECRLPYLDYRVVEFAASLSHGMKLRNFTEKYILRRLAKGRVPRKIVARKKQRFYLPIDTWFADVLGGNIESFLASSEVLNEKAIHGLLRYKGSGSYKYILKHGNLLKLFYSRKVWSLLTFEVWYQTFFRDDIRKPLRLKLL